MDQRTFLKILRIILVMIRVYKKYCNAFQIIYRRYGFYQTKPLFYSLNQNEWCQSGLENYIVNQNKSCTKSIRLAKIFM